MTHLARQRANYLAKNYFGQNFIPLNPGDKYISNINIFNFLRLMYAKF